MLQLPVAGPWARTVGITGPARPRRGRDEQQRDERQCDDRKPTRHRGRGARRASLPARLCGLLGVEREKLFQMDSERQLMETNQSFF